MEEVSFIINICFDRNPLANGIRQAYFLLISHLKRVLLQNGLFFIQMKEFRFLPIALQGKEERNNQDFLPKRF